MKKSKRIATSNAPNGDFEVDAQALMFDTTGIHENSILNGSPSPRGKYAPVLHKYTLPPKKQRGVGGIDNGKSPRKNTTKRYKKGGAVAVAGSGYGGAIANGVAS